MKPFVGFFRGLAAAIVALTLAAPASAQVSTFDLFGTVIDQSGAVLPGGSVTLRNVKTGLSRETVTDERGRYHFAALPPVGEYSVKVSLAGFSSQERAGLVFAANSAPVIDFTLNLAALAETVSVRGEAPLLETRKSELSVTVDQKRIETMPLNGRNYMDLAQLSIGVHTAAARGDISINGQLGRNIDYVIDGVSNKVNEWGDASKTGLSLDIIQEFQVISSQFSAEFGNALGGIVSAVTKTGTNDLHGTAFLYERPGRLDANDRLSQTKAPFDQQQFGGTFSGPIIKNKTHFFGAYEGTNQDSMAVVTSVLQPGAFPTSMNQHLAFGKATHQFTSNETLSVRFNWDTRTSIGGFGGLVLPDGGGKSVRSGRDWQGTQTSVLSERMINELRFQFSQFVNESTNLTTAPRSVYTGLGTFGGGTGSPQDIHEVRLQFVDKLSRDFGSHRTSYGVDASHIAKTGVYNASFQGQYTFAPGAKYPFNAADPATWPIQFVQGFNDPRRPFTLQRDFAPFDFAGVDRRYVNVGLFAQDNWEVTRGLTVNLGIRYQKQTANPPNKDVMPRTGFAWDIGKNGKTVLRGGAGRFYDQLPDTIRNIEDLFGVIGNFNVTLTPSGNPGIFPTYPAILSNAPGGSGPVPGRSVYIDYGTLNPQERRTPYGDQFTLGVSRQLVSNLAVNADLTYLRAHNLYRVVDLNGPVAFDTTTGARRTAAQADLTRPYGVPSSAPGPYGLSEGGFKQIYAYVSDGNSWYRALALNITKRLSRRHFYQVAYTLSNSENEQDDIGANANGIGPNAFVRSTSMNDVTHALVISGSYILPYDISMSGILNVRSGLPVDPLAGVDLNGDTFLNDRPGTLARNSFRRPAYKKLDIALAKTIRLGGRSQAELRADVFNVLNALDVSGINNSYGTDPLTPSATFLSPTIAYPPRQFQFSIRFRF